MEFLYTFFSGNIHKKRVPSIQEAGICPRERILKLCKVKKISASLIFSISLSNFTYYAISFETTSLNISAQRLHLIKYLRFDLTLRLKSLAEFLVGFHTLFAHKLFKCKKTDAVSSEIVRYRTRQKKHAERLCIIMAALVVPSRLILKPLVVC